MKRILLRAGKVPWDLLSAEATYAQNLISGNNGNYLFTHAAHKMLSTKGAQVVAGGVDFDPADAPRINDEFDAFVIPLANAFRLSFAPRLERLTKLVEQLTIPVVMLSGGAQSAPEGGFKHLEPIESLVKRFAAAMLDRSTELTVRGEYTAQYLADLGVDEVRVIGCPSMTLRGPKLRVSSDVPGSDLESLRIAYNLETSKTLAGGLVAQAERYHRATYYPQERPALGMLLWGNGYPEYSRADPRLPYTKNHHQFTQQTARYMLDVYPWIQEMSTMDFSFGTRIHGNIAAVLAGTPAVVLTHDSRTLELAKFHGLPYFTPKESAKLDDFDELLAQVDFADFNAGQEQRFSNVASFLNRNGLATIFDEGQEDTLREYERRIAVQNYPAAQTARWAGLSLFERAKLRLNSPVERRGVVRRKFGRVKRYVLRRLSPKDSPIGRGHESW